MSTMCALTLWAVSGVVSVATIITLVNRYVD